MLVDEANKKLKNKTSKTSEKKLHSSLQGSAVGHMVAPNIALITVLLLASLVFSISVGSTHIPLDQVWASFVGQGSTDTTLIIMKLRLPRALTGAIVGMCLALAGCILQAIMRNHLASPSTIGVTAGASFAGYLCLVAMPSLAPQLPLFTFLGAFGTTMVVYALARRGGASSTQLILSGLAISALFSAFSNLIKTFYAENLQNVAGFLVGGLNGVVWVQFRSIVPYALLGVLLCFLLPRRMNVLLLGDETALSLGLNVQRFRFVLIVCSSLLAGAAISVVGLLSFVGLIVPHIARLLVGTDHHKLLPFSALMGAAMVTACDSLGRTVMEPGEIPVSIIMGCLGAPFFLYLLRSKK